MLLSLPPLLLGLFGGVGYVARWLGDDIVTRLRSGIESFSERFLVPDVVTGTILPTADDVLRNGRGDLISLGFLLSVWSGSRALNVFVDTISIMYGQSGVRGIVRTRVLSLTLYFLSLLVGVVVIPLVVLGPSLLGELLPEPVHFLTYLYWPVVTIVAVASISTLFHISTPRRTPWLRDVPGGVLTLVIWVLASFVLRGTITASLDGTSIYGPLSTPIVLLIFLYALAIAVLIGAALNAAIREMWPVEERPSLRAQTVEWVKGRVADLKEGAPGQDAEPEAARAARAADEDALSGSVASLRLEARKPLTPIHDAEAEQSEGRTEPSDGLAGDSSAAAGGSNDTDGTRFGDESKDRIMSVRTRSGA
jgi:membrane protein